MLSPTRRLARPTRAAAVPATTVALLSATTASAAGGHRATRHVPRRRLRRGDLLIFYRPVSHVGIYLGRGRMVHASSSDDDVERTRVYWRSFVGGGRPR